MRGQLIGEGNTAEVYEWGDKAILKLFRKGMPCEAIEREYQVNKVIEKFGLSIPEAKQLIEVDGRKGIIYTKITGESLLGKIMKHPLSMNKCIKKIANLHWQIHSCTASELPKQKEVLGWNIRHTKELTDSEKMAVLDRLKKLPQGDALCHGDFHPGNVMASGDTLYLLDWMTGTAGTPAADAARTMLLLKDAAIPGKMSKAAKVIIGITRKYMARIYLKQYLKLSGLHKEDIDRWRVPIAAARLIEWIPEEEKKFLLKVIRKSI
jgi:uncharacterized protein (TIGR02172 family)